jgi:hypothetical protein
VYVKESRWRGPREPAERPLPRQQFPSLESSRFQPSSLDSPCQLWIEVWILLPLLLLCLDSRGSRAGLFLRSRASASKDTSVTPVWWESGGESDQVHALVEGGTSTPTGVGVSVSRGGWRISGGCGSGGGRGGRACEGHMTIGWRRLTVGYRFLAFPNVHCTLGFYKLLLVISFQVVSGDLSGLPYRAPYF